MDLLVPSAADVAEALSYADCADAVREGLVALAMDQAQIPLRTVIRRWCRWPFLATADYEEAVQLMAARHRRQPPSSASGPGSPASRVS